MNFSKSMNATIYVQYLKAQSQNADIHAAVHEKHLPTVSVKARARGLHSPKSEKGTQPRSSVSSGQRQEESGGRQGRQGLALNSF